MRATRLVILILLLSTIFSGCNKPVENDRNESKPELFISAAASLSDALEEIRQIYEQENELELVINYGGSGKLAQQIQQGAPVDVFLSANTYWMNVLSNENEIKEDTIVNIVENKLVLITDKDSMIDYLSFADIQEEDVEQIAIGNPASVPAGAYAESILTDLGKWEELEEKFVFVQDVRQVLTYVETGNADIGFVYASDASRSDDVKIVVKADAALHEPIVYPGALTMSSDLAEEGKQFLQFLQSETDKVYLRNTVLVN